MAATSAMGWIVPQTHTAAWSDPCARRDVRRLSFLGARERGYSALQAALSTRNRPEPWAHGWELPHPSLLLALHCDPLRLHLGPWSQLLPSVAPQPFLLLWQRQKAWAVSGQETTVPALCSRQRLQPVPQAGPAWWCLFSAPSLWPPQLIIWRPQRRHWQQFSQSLSPEQIVWELCQLVKKICFVNRGRSLFYAFC